MDSNATQALQYFINKKETVIVVSMEGSLSERESPILNKCLDEIIVTGIKHVLLNMSGLTDVDPSAIRSMIIFQQALRTKSLEIKLCALKHEHKVLLDNAGAIRNHELFPD